MHLSTCKKAHWCFHCGFPITNCMGRCSAWWLGHRGPCALWMDAWTSHPWIHVLHDRWSVGQELVDLTLADMWSSPTPLDPLGSRVLITNRQRWTVTAVLFRCRRQMVWPRFPTIAGMWMNTSIHRPKWDVSWALDSQVAWVTLRERTPTEHIST